MSRIGLVPSSKAPHGGLRRTLHKWGAAVVVASGLAAAVTGSGARDKHVSQADQGAVVALATLPLEAQDTHRLVLAGGPFAYRKDGVVFGNRERQLPAKARGYYHEYTVKTPGSADRGARRIVCGGTPPATPDACYYTDNHYASFRRIVSSAQ